MKELLILLLLLALVESHVLPVSIVLLASLVFFDLLKVWKSMGYSAAYSLTIWDQKMLHSVYTGHNRSKNWE